MQSQQEQSKYKTDNNPNKANSQENLNKQKDAENVISEEEANHYDYTKIKNEEIAKNLVNPNEVDVSTIRVAMVDGKPEMMAKENNSTNFKVIESYTSKNAIGEIDSIENGEERKIGKGEELTFINRSGEHVTLDIQKKSGEIEVRDVSNDLDNDGTNEAPKLNTSTYNEKPQASELIDKYKKYGYNILDNKEKEEIGIDTTEYNEGKLSDEQIKKVFEEREVSENVRRKVISQIGEENPTLDTLDKMIDDAEASEIDEKEDETLEPGYTRDRAGRLCFHGRPIE